MCSIKIRYILFLIFALLSKSFCQTKPFPQNINYPNGFKTSVISTQNIQTAYNRWKNSFLKTCNGMYRVSGDDTTISISEGMGFGMVLTAYFGEKQFYDGLLNFYKSKRTDQAYNLMGWRVTCDSIIDPGSATDGDIDVAYSLIIAHFQWGGNYLEEAKNIIAILKNNYFERCGEDYYVLKPGGQFGGCELTDIQYYTPAYFRLFGEITNDPFWETITNHSYIILKYGTNDTTGLVPDWQTFDGIPGGGPNTGRANYYGYDACRTPFRMSLDYLWNGDTTAKNWCTKISNFAASIGPTRIVDGYNLNGSARGQYNNSAFVGGFAVGSMCKSQSIVDNFAQRLVALNNSGDNQYFNLSLRCIYMLVLTGNFWKPDSSIFTGILKGKALPFEFKLNQNYPNPFNPSTTISYSLPEEANVKLDIYNFIGQKIAVLVDENKTTGNYKIQWNAQNLSSGIYFCRLRAEGKKTIEKFQKLVLIK